MRQLMSYLTVGLLLFGASGCYVWYPVYVGPVGRNSVPCDIGGMPSRRAALRSGRLGYDDMNYGGMGYGINDYSGMGYGGMSAPSSCGCGGAAPMGGGTILPPGGQMLPPGGNPMNVPGSGSTYIPGGTPNFSPNGSISPNPIMLPN